MPDYRTYVIKPAEDPAAVKTVSSGFDIASLVPMIAQFDAMSEQVTEIKEIVSTLSKQEKVGAGRKAKKDGENDGQD